MPSSHDLAKQDERALTSAYRTRTIVAFATARVTWAATALLLAFTWGLHAASKILVVGVIALAATACTLLAYDLHKRATWYREPGTKLGPWLTLAGGAIDAALLLFVATIATSSGSVVSVFPAAAIIKMSALLSVVGTLFALARRKRPRPVSPEELAASAARLLGAAGAWIVADRVVPEAWRAEQALHTGIAMLILVVVSMMSATLARRIHLHRE